MNRLMQVTIAMMVCVPIPAFSEEGASVNEVLLQHVFAEIQQDRAIQPGPVSDSCPARFDSQDSPKAQMISQFIYNGAYRWMEFDNEGFLCIYMLYPFERMLSPEEARRFVQASHYDFLIPEGEDLENKGSEPLPTTKFDDQMIIEIEDGKIIRKGPEVRQRDSDGGRSDGRAPLGDFGFPWPLTAMVQTGTGSSVTTGSAIQVSPYAYATAAHVVLNKSNGQQYQNIRVFPGYRIPNPTTSITINSVDYDTTWLSATGGQEIAKDLAFLRANVASFKPQYPRVHHVNEHYDRGTGPVGGPTTDPWALHPNTFVPGCTDSWQRFWLHNPQAPGICNPGSNTYVSRISIGYPDYVGSINNTSVRNPYTDQGFIWGWPAGYFLYQLNPQFPFTGLQMTVSPGQSGGPVIGQIRQHHVNGYISSYYAIIGIVTNSLNTHPGGPMPFTLASGDFGYNWQRWEANIAWNPNTFTATPNPVYTSGPTGNWVLSWNTPAYSAVDAYAINSLAGPQEIFIGSASSPGSTPQVNAVGMIGTIRFFRHGDYTYPLGTLIVRILSQ